MPDADIPDELEHRPIPLAPVALQERIALIDVLRGIAVFGIFLINMPLYLAPSDGFFQWENNALWSDPADRLATAFIYIFAQGKFYTLFSFLFGLGFGVQLLRAAQRYSPNFLTVYRRRLFALLVIGTLHFFLIWWGDVLHVYALLGFALLQFRDRSDKTLLVWAAYLTFVPFVLAIGGTTISRLTDEKTSVEKQKKRDVEKKEAKEKIEKDLQVKSGGTFGDIVILRFRRNLRQLAGEAKWSIELFTSFLLGLWVSRRRIFQEPELYRQLLAPVAFIVLPLSLLVAGADAAYGYQHPNQDVTPLWRMHLELIREFLARPGVAFGYAAALLLIGTEGWMSPLAAVGRMALTNYLLHSLVFTTIANSYGLGLYGKIHPAQGLALCFAFFALQLPFSVWWLRRHQYGPAEWLWRSLTYGERQPWLKLDAGSHAIS